MSSVCLTCDESLNKPSSKCVFTAQGDVQCYNDGDSPESQMNAAVRQIRTAAPGTPAAQVYPVRGVDSDSYYRYISDLSGQPIQNRYIEQIPVEQTNSCAAKVDNSVKNSDSSHAKGLPEWGPHASWLSEKDAKILKDPLYAEPFKNK
jgi:hypothetical protein